MRAVGRRNEFKAFCRRLTSNVSPERVTVPGDERQLEQRRGWASEIPVEDPDEIIAAEANVVWRDVVVADQGPRSDVAEAPRPGVLEAGHSAMKGPRPSDDGFDLPSGEHFGVDVDHSTG